LFFSFLQPPIPLLLFSTAPSAHLSTHTKQFQQF
jgi:hypothetical protein